MDEQQSSTEREVGRAEVEEFMEGIFGGDLHAQRVDSLTDGVDGVLHAASLGIRAIGQGLAAAQGLASRHAIKQVDRLLSNAWCELSYQSTRSANASEGRPN